MNNINLSYIDCLLFATLVTLTISYYEILKDIHNRFNPIMRIVLVIIIQAILAFMYYSLIKMNYHG